MIRNELDDQPASLPKVQSVHRALRLLKLMTIQGQISVAEAAAELDVHASSAQRLLATLVGDGFAVQDEHRRYLAGPAFLEAGRLATTVSLPVKLRPALERLYTQVQETVHVVTLIGTSVHHIDGIRDTSHALQFGGRVGVILPAHITSSGRAMLAQLSKIELEDRYLADPDNEAGVKGLEDMEALYRTVILTRQQGMGMNFGETEDGVAAFGTAVGVIDGQHVGLSIAMPNARFKKDLIPHFRTHLDAAAADIRAAQENPLP
ncbi:IclR family transcriptional regulator [Brevibacterium sp. UCMA 11754]|uniref:IclR family transcriptional regulator n=1 Tax=Brevibacterium sp. UCMA 11754 TaxID=2749198 RepID=UPI001F162356|nr:IclR family transcriptional regulator C-terminal domain-containing protein [Brevibacterium sp. UCMA 11754]MCF2573861.1 helix-turn-helix domain-containing protein [Brevibacterium sp. UCMA 11754]